MKLSVSLSDDDVVLIDAFVVAHGLTSRSAAVQHAVRLLRHPELEQDYATAWAEWDSSGQAAAWEPVVADEVDRAAG